MAGLTLDQFWNHTPFELTLVASGYTERLRRQQELLAWHVCHIINLWSKRRMTPKKLLRGGGDIVDVEHFANAEELEDYLESHRERRLKEPD